MVRPRNSGSRKHEEPTSLPVPQEQERPPVRDVAIGFCLVAVFFILGWSALSNFWHDRTAPELQRGLKALTNNQVTEAQHFFDGVLAQNPDDPALYLRILQECEKYRQWNLLVQYGERAILNCRYAPPVVRSFLHVSLANGYLGCEKKGDALIQAKRAWELKRDEPLMMNHYGYMLADLARSPSELKFAEKLLTDALQKLRPEANTPDGLWKLVMVEDSYGWLLYRQGKYQEAVTVLTKALDSVPASLEVEGSLQEMYYHLGAAYHRVGRYAEARKMLEVALYYDSNFRDAREELDALLTKPLIPPTFLPGPQFDVSFAFTPQRASNPPPSIERQDDETPRQ
jgi:tetratricopeptide (TPR) repeat protein